MILSDREIIERVEKERMIEPFVAHQVREGVISYGLSSYGYDIRIADEFLIFTPNPYNTVVDPKNVDNRAFVRFQGDVCVIPPNSYVLGRSLEYFRIPRDILCIVLGKSSYARSGIICNVTPGEPGWEGHWTIEIGNATSLPAKVYSNEGIAQVIFLRASQECAVSYADRKGKYQRQQGIVLPRID